MPTSGDDGIYGKRLLVDVSHAMERFALAAPPPSVVIAMFQKYSYFEREVEMYRAIAATGAVVVVGLAEDLPPRLPPGVRHALVGADDPLAREWSITVLGPHGGATLVATDLEQVAAGSVSLESGRQFRGRWSYRRDDAYREILRLRSALPMSADTVAAIDDVLAEVVAVPEPQAQGRWDAPLRFLTDRADRADRRRIAAEAQLTALRESDRDPRTGLHTVRFLERWTRGLGEGTLPIGLVLLRVLGVSQVRAQHGLRAELAALQGVASSVGSMLGDVDTVVRMGRDDFLAVLPSWTRDDVARFGEEACARMGELAHHYPFVELPGVAAATVTRRRPLPIPQLAHQVAGASRTRQPLRVLAG
ncbi:DICT sensory domain-containing protein [Pseudonocardia oroxyli]|uniref:GGDEF domain-containing protein, diguanylate cyclase (C-di-GMP synthetase) or its enzymatically inactive variants n=1 Tax=Pseudonocardia oroxyli TaxID=366584 RepID=A0A1G7PJM0_PSEOR|nr:DICT sensory domain-containing protein [Pseudonocardia oroxyli]SDF86495.1 GGDEF domain-containing protein, diguanylate cyclase (c-di-GMP synthetase) or its enzymatically inactive variants [Pseudonocardia oroxyli]